MKKKHSFCVWLSFLLFCELVVAISRSSLTRLLHLRMTLNYQQNVNWYELLHMILKVERNCLPFSQKPSLSLMFRSVFYFLRGFETVVFFISSIIFFLGEGPCINNCFQLGIDNFPILIFLFCVSKNTLSKNTLSTINMAFMKVSVVDLYQLIMY